MKKQILSLMLGVMILAANPAFAMDGDSEDTEKTCFPVKQSEFLQVFSESFCNQVKSFPGYYVEMVKNVFEDIPEAERYDIANLALRCFYCKPELATLPTIRAFATVKRRSEFLNFLTENKVDNWGLWDLSNLTENSDRKEWTSIFCKYSSSPKAEGKALY